MNYWKTDEDLFRNGNKTTPGFHKVRTNRPDGKSDIQTDGNYVLHDTGGVSVFSEPQDGWKNPWVLPKSAQMDPNLKVVKDKDSDTHRTIQPVQKTLQKEYEGYLDKLNPQARKWYPTPQTASTSQSTSNQYAGSYATSPPRPAPTPTRNTQATLSSSYATSPHRSTPTPTRSTQATPSGKNRSNNRSFGQPDPRSRSNQ